MAKDVGLKWPPPPPVSVRNLIRLAGGQVSALDWGTANPFTILIDQGQDAWHAGHVNDILVVDTGEIVVGTDTGGVWLVDSKDSATPLSDDWNNTNVTCLAFGPDGPSHIFAGGGDPYGGATLFETDTSQKDPLSNWRGVPLTRVTPAAVGIGTIYRIAVLKKKRRIVLACSNGVFWSPIPDHGNAYDWRQVPSLPQGAYSGVAIGPNDRIVIAAWGSDPSTGLCGIFCADWSTGDLLPIQPFGLRALAKALGSDTVSGIARKLGYKWPPPPRISVRNLLTRSLITGAEETKMFRTSLASCEGQSDTMYAVSSRSSDAHDKEWMYAVLKSKDGGRSWSRLRTNVLGMNVPLESGPAPAVDVAGGQGSYNNCIAVSAHNPNLVAIGWRNGPYISTDGGVNWARHTDQDTPHLHSDLHAVYFDPNDRSGRHLWIGSDGGLALTPDQGQTFASHMNKHLLNLQFYGGKFSTSYTTTALSPGAPGLFAGATQDNGNLYCMMGAPWTCLEGGDGGLMMFAGPDDLLHWFNTQQMLDLSQWDGSQFNDLGFVSASGLPRIPVAPVCAIVNNPSKRNGAGLLIRAIAASAFTDMGVFGIFDSQGSGMHYELLGEVPSGLGLGPITALGSHDGRMVFVGKKGGLIYVINTDERAIQQTPVEPLQDPSEGDDGASIDRIVVVSDKLAFAILSNSKYVAGSNFILRWNGGSWNAVGAGRGLPDDPFNPFRALEATDRKPLFTLFAATDNKVFESDDEGDTWQAQSRGLPAEPKCSDLQFVAEPTFVHGTVERARPRFLYLSTYGRSIWRARL